MGVRRRGIGGGLLAGLGQGLSHLAESRVKRRQFQDVQAAEQQKQLQQALASLGSNIAEHPNSYQLQTQVASQNPLLRGVDLSGFTPSNDVLLRPLGAQIQSADELSKLPGDLSFAAKLLGANIPAYQPPQMAPTDEGPADPVTELPPALQPYAAQLLKRKVTLQQGQEAAIEKAGATKKAEAYGTGVGSGQAAHENAPTATADAVADLTAKGPVQAANAGLTSGAQFDAQHTPDRLKADAQGAGMNAAAVAGAQAPFEAARAAAADERKPATDAERGAASFYVRSIRGHNAALDLENKGVNFWAANTLPTVVQSSLMKQYNQAQKEFILAALRKETGAAISPQELTDFAVTYFGQAGDPPDVIQKKQEARAALIQGLKPQAGRAMQEYQQQGITPPAIANPGQSARDKLRNRP